MDVPSPHAVASFVYCPTYCNIPGNNKIDVTDQMALAVHRLSAQHQSDNRHAALADCLTDVDTVGDFTFWISLSLRPKTETEA